jgi:Galactose oxidase, central domain
MFVSLLPSPSSLIIMFCRFGGYDGRGDLNDTWSFDISTRKWTELQCTGSIPSPRSGHATVFIDDVMYVFGGCTDDETYVSDLTAFNLSSKLSDSAVGPHALVHIRYPAQRWTAFQDIGPSPCERWIPAMTSDGTRVFVLGGDLSAGAQVDEDEANLIHVLDTSMYFLFVISFRRPSSLKQSSSFTRNPTPTLSSIARRPPNLRRS